MEAPRLGFSWSYAAGVAKRSSPAAYGMKQVPGVYRMGVEVIKVGGVIVYKHDGFWGTRAAYVSSLDVAIGATVTQQYKWDDLRNTFQRAFTLIRAAVETQQAQSQARTFI